MLALIAVMLSACTDEPPDTSAPERVEIDRTSDWQGALLYIADGKGPVEGWGSIRIFDNVSGFVESTVEQTMAAVPSDLYVVSNGSEMFVTSMANGVVDMFFWDGNAWRRGSSKIATPSRNLYAIEAGPDGLLYLAGITEAGTTGALFKLVPDTGELQDEALVIDGITEARGITWSTDGATAYVTGTTPQGASLVMLAWPGGNIANSTSLPVGAVNQPQISPDGKTLYIACAGQILTADPASGTLTGSLAPAPDSATEYYDVAFSADGRYIFAPGTPPGGDTTLYVIDITTGATVNQITHVSIKANGIKRTE